MDTSRFHNRGGYIAVALKYLLDEGFSLCRHFEEENVTSYLYDFVP